MGCVSSGVQFPVIHTFGVRIAKNSVAISMEPVHDVDMKVVDATINAFVEQAPENGEGVVDQNIPVEAGEED